MAEKTGHVAILENAVVSTFGTLRGMHQNVPLGVEIEGFLTRSEPNTPYIFASPYHYYQTDPNHPIECVVGLPDESKKKIAAAIAATIEADGYVATLPLEQKSGIAVEMVQNHALAWAEACCTPRNGPRNDNPHGADVINLSLQMAMRKVMGSR